MTDAPPLGGIAHVAVVVADMAATAAWWERVLGFERLARYDEPPGEQRHPRILVRHPGSGLVVGIHQPHGHTGEAFDPDRTGLDHLALTVPSREALDAWLARLDALGVEHSPVRDIGRARFVTLADPGGTALELWLVSG